jgi:hypothetical protein
MRKTKIIATEKAETLQLCRQLPTLKGCFGLAGGVTTTVACELIIGYI